MTANKQKYKEGLMSEFGFCVFYDQTQCVLSSFAIILLRESCLSKSYELK